MLPLWKWGSCPFGLRVSWGFVEDCPLKKRDSRSLCGKASGSFRVTRGSPSTSQNKPSRAWFAEAKAPQRSLERRTNFLEFCKLWLLGSGDLAPPLAFRGFLAWARQEHSLHRSQGPLGLGVSFVTFGPESEVEERLRGPGATNFREQDAECR